MLNYIDLHTHSTASDGIYAPAELLQRAKDIGLRIVALTDHDSTGGLQEAVQEAGKLDIDLIPGIEINTGIPGRTQSAARCSRAAGTAHGRTAE
jgi:predicted metal-dependent phosphoesterase TrpH